MALFSVEFSAEANELLSIFGLFVAFTGEAFTSGGVSGGT